MSSMIAFFHKHYDIQERKFKATNRMRRNVKRLQQRVSHVDWEQCGKCEEFFDKADLSHDDLSDSTFCTNCMNAINILRDV